MKAPVLLPAAALVLVAVRADAAPPWVERGLTLPQFGVAFDAGLGIAHVTGNGNPDNPDRTGPGLNLDLDFGITHNLEIGLRTGVRFGDDAKATQADRYGRLFDTETYGTGGDLFANPEFLIRGRLVNVRVFELALEGRVYLPFEQGTYPGMMFGVPMRFHLGGIARIDLGLYVPVIFTPRDVTDVVSIPAQFWFQPTDRFFIGPMTGLRFLHFPGPANDRTDVLFGLGLGYQVSRFADIKTDFLFPRINGTPAGREFGFGFGVGLTFD